MSASFKPGSSNAVASANSLDRSWEELSRLTHPPGAETDPRLALSYELVLNAAELNVLDAALNGRPVEQAGREEQVAEHLHERVRRAASWRAMVPLLIRRDDVFTREAGGSGAELSCLERHATLDWVLDAQAKLNSAMTDADLKAGVRMPLLTVVFGNRRFVEQGVSEFLLLHYQQHTSGLAHRYALVGGQALAGRLKHRPITYGFDEDDEDFPHFEES